MTIYGAFEPGSFNAWTLNQITDVFCTPGVARGGQVTAPGGMNVTLGVDPVASDAVIVLPNGAYVRTDQAITFVVPSNNGSGTRSDAIVAFVDPTGVASPSFSLTYTTSWAGGFTGNTNNQWVVALVSVAVGAVSISGANITQNPLVANFGNPSFVQAYNDQNGFLVYDSANSTFLITGYNHSTQPTPNPRSVVLVAQDSSGGLHYFTHDYLGALTIPSNLYLGPPDAGAYSFFAYDGVNHLLDLFTPQAGATAKGIEMVVWNGSQQNSIFGFGNFGGATSWIDQNSMLRLRSNGQNGNQDPLQLTSYSSIGHAVNLGCFLTGFYVYDAFQAGFIFQGLNSLANVMTHNTNANADVAQRIFTGTVTPTGATNGDIWINA